MKIAFLTSRFPYPPDRGDRLTVFNLLRALSRRHQVTLIAFTDGHEPPGASSEVGPHCQRIETVRLAPLRSWAQAWLGLFSSRPSQVSFYQSGAMRRRVRGLLAQGGFDLIFNHTIRMAPFVLDVEHPCKVLWLGDSLGLALGRSMPFEPWWKHPGIAWERRRVDRFEAMISARFHETWALSELDRQDLERIGCRNVVIVTHGVDERLFELERRPEARARVMFLGHLGVPHNMDAAQFAAREVWPLVRREAPTARLVIAGASPARSVRRLGRIEGVEMIGPFPDLRPLWETASLLLAPLRFSTGIQNKLLEAMAAGVPVVTTPPAAEAIHAQAGDHLLAADSAAGLARAVLETLHDSAAARERAVRARELVRRHFSWETAVHRLEQALLETRAAKEVAVTAGSARGPAA